MDNSSLQQMLQNNRLKLFKLLLCEEYAKMIRLFNSKKVDDLGKWRLVSRGIVYVPASLFILQTVCSILPNNQRILDLESCDKKHKQDGEINSN